MKKKRPKACWISGKVSKIDNQDGKFKLPHIGWNQITLVRIVKFLKI
jgi:glutamine amidotransferase